jgi:hypothetical protein
MKLDLENVQSWPTSITPFETIKVIIYFLIVEERDVHWERIMSTYDMIGHILKITGILLAQCQWEF